MFSGDVLSAHVLLLGVQVPNLACLQGISDGIIDLSKNHICIFIYIQSFNKIVCLIYLIYFGTLELL